MTGPRIDEIKQSGRARKDLGDVSALAESIQRVGLLHPVVVTPELRLIAGARRIAAAECLGWERIPVTVPDGIDSASVHLQAERDENTERKSLTPSEAVDLGLRLEELEKPEAEARQREHGGTAPGRPANTEGNLPEVKGRTTEKAASGVGLGRRTYEKAKAVVAAAEEAPEEFGDLVEVMDATGKVDGPHREMLKRNAPKPVVPEGLFSVICADPPWEYRNSGLAGAASEHYATMSTKALCGLPVDARAADDAVLFLWATNPLLVDALAVMSAWGFEYKSNLVWVKNRETYGKLGFYLLGRHELLLIGTRGSMVPESENRQASVIETTKRQHSRKPDEAYALIEGMYPDAVRLELFARTEREGWTAMGNEVGKW